MPDRDEEAAFRKRLRRAPSKPASRYGGYVVAASLAVMGATCSIVAKSQPIFLSGFLLMGAGVVAALLAYRANRHWFG
jgi:NaMN:DMB phosphoribosyltransferase